MMPHPRFKLTQRALLALIVSSAFSAEAAAEVARVNFASGEVTATGADGRTRTLGKGAEINVGETVNTENGRAQLSFNDGAYVSLQPRTQFRIDDFRFNGKNDGEEKGFFSLLKGGLRTITGAIGKGNRDAYKVATTTATIGIRGTEYLASVTNSLDVSVAGGSLSVSNNAGTFSILEGQSAHFADVNSLPILHDDKPVLQPQGTQEGGGTPPPAPPTIPSVGSLLTPLTGTGTFNMAVSLISHQNSSFLANFSPTTATLNNAGLLTSFVDSGAEGGLVTQGTTIFGSSLGQGLQTSVPVAGNDGIIAWNRWTGGITGGAGRLAGNNVTGGEGLHYVIGVATPLNDMQALKNSQVMATYNLIGATNPVNTNNFSGRVNSGSLTADFTNAQVTTTLNLSIQNNSSNSALTTYNINASGSISGSTFGGSGSATVQSGPGSGPISTSIQGFFAGANAARAGLAYNVGNGVAQGVAAFAIGSKTTSSVRPPL